MIIQSAAHRSSFNRSCSPRVYSGVVGYNVDVEYSIIRNTVVEELRLTDQVEIRTFKDLLHYYTECFIGSNLWRTIGSALPICAQQLTGLAFLNTYASFFFKQSGFTNAFLITTILSIVSLVTALFVILTSDKFGRRVIVITAAVGATLMMMVVAVLGLVPKIDALHKLLIFIACVWSVCSVALGGLGWTFVGEIASQRLRARTAGLAAASSVVLGLTFNTSVPVMLDSTGANWNYQTGWLFFGTGIVICVVCYFYLPEPAKRNAAELDEMFFKRIPAWRMKDYVTEVQEELSSELAHVTSVDKSYHQ